MASGTGKPKPAFLIAVAIVVLGLCGVAFYRCNAKQAGEGGTASSGSGGGFVDPRKDPSAGSAQAESNDPNAPATTVKEYSFEPASKLPEVPGTASYSALGKTRIVKFAVNIWAGWAPIVWANQGSKAGKIWKDAKGGDFQLELVLADNPIEMGNKVANGDVHIGWATVDMLPLVIKRLKKDPRTMPRVFQQIDWSNGGDGIVVRKDIKDVASLRGKTVVLAQNSPSHYFLLNMLLNAGVQPSEVKMKFTPNAFEAAAAYNAQSDLAGVVTWAPDIYKLTEGSTKNRMLVSTLEANKLIADVWFARADFARDNPEIIEGLVRGILDATEDLGTDANKKSVGEMMDKFYGLDPGTGLSMLGDAHWTNYAENRDFFMVQSNPTNFERTYNTAVRLYRSINALEASDAVDFDQVMDFSVIKKLGTDAKYASSKSNYEFKFTPAGSDLNVESEVLTKTVRINFFPNSYEVYKKVPAKDGSGTETFYDGNVDYTIEEIAKLAGQFGAARIVIEGHTDGSMKGQADESLVKDLANRRANAVKEALVNKYKMNPNQFTAAGIGWARPADPEDPNNHAKNRRVEVKVVPAEAQ